MAIACCQMVASWQLASNLIVKFLQANLQDPFFCCHVMKLHQNKTMIIAFPIMVKFKNNNDNLRFQFIQTTIFLFGTNFVF
jgi:hypothetical protein